MSAPPSAVPRFAHEAMTTLFEIFIPGPDEIYAGQAAREAFREIDRLEARFNRFDPGSEISRINRLLPGEETTVGIETFECLALAEAVRLETGGAFDANARAAALDAFAEGRDAKPEPAPFELLGGAGSCLVRRLEEERPGHGPIDLDLGGIGKGYALDRAGQLLLTWGVPDALLHGGTSTVLALGSPAAASGTEPSRESSERTGWPVGIGAGWPGAPERVFLSGRALSGSGTEVKGGHILDPRTGRPARGNLAAWASAPTAALSDALSTAFFIMTADGVEACAARNPEIGACLVVAYGDVRIFNPRFFPAGG